MMPPSKRRPPSKGRPPGWRTTPSRRKPSQGDHASTRMIAAPEKPLSATRLLPTRSQKLYVDSHSKQCIHNQVRGRRRRLYASGQRKTRQHNSAGRTRTKPRLNGGRPSTRGRPNKWPRKEPRPGSKRLAGVLGTISARVAP